MPHSEMVRTAFRVFVLEIFKERKMADSEELEVQLRELEAERAAQGGPREFDMGPVHLLQMENLLLHKKLADMENEKAMLAFQGLIAQAYGLDPLTEEISIDAQSGKISVKPKE